MHPLNECVLASPRHGVLALVVGPSGAGKDALIDGARSMFAGDGRFVFPMRVVTREPCCAEAHGAMSVEEFDEARMNGYFGLSWGAHGLNYGIVAADIAWIEVGRTVVVNVSRSVIADAEAIASNIVVFNIIAPPEVLAKRIASRGRENRDQIEMRLARVSPLSVERAQIVTIENDRDLKSAVDRFCAGLLRAHVSTTSPNA